MRKEEFESLVMEYEEGAKKGKRAVADIAYRNGDAYVAGLKRVGNGELWIPSFVVAIFGKLQVEGIKTVVIEEGVREIGPLVFDCKGLETGHIGRISIPDSIEVIGDRAFRGVYAEGLRVPESVKSLGEGAYMCSGIKEVRLLGDNVVLYRDVFLSCNELTGVFVGSGVKEIGIDAFGFCQQLKDIKVVKDEMDQRFLGFFRREIINVTRSL